MVIGGPLELPLEHLDLSFDGGRRNGVEGGALGSIWFEDESVEANFADSGVRGGQQGGVELLLPVGGAVADIPGVDAVARHNPREAF